MIASSVKIKGFSCFKNTRAGLDEFKPITVIIGRNNTGKSHLVDLVELLTKNKLAKTGYEVSCSGTLDETFLEIPFSKTDSGRDLGPSYTHFFEEHSHWNETGKHYIGQRVSWGLDPTGQPTSLDVKFPPRGKTSYRIAAEKTILKHLRGIESPLSEMELCRILADRDIRPEPALNQLKLDANGAGATNIIRRLITSSSHSEDLIQVELRDALDEIFGGDGNFKRIEVQQHDETPVEDHNLWEVFLGETKKDLVPLSSSGSGLKTVILVLLNLLVVPTFNETRQKSEFVFAFEELENNLHPALLRRLLKYLTEYVLREKCHLFLTTHSNVALDFFGTHKDTQIIHVTHDGESASANTITSHFDHVGLLTELGSRPSDLLQANGVIWLEGPSDRHYFNCFIELFSNGDLREGYDYQCAFYGGSNLANSTFSDPGESDDTLTNLLRLNNNIAVICDGDRTADTGKGSRIKGRVLRIKQEVEKIPSTFLWITEAKEIENYIPGSVWAVVYKKSNIPDPSKYDMFPSGSLNNKDFVCSKLKRKSFDKCDFAMKAVNHLTRKSLAASFELETEMNKLVNQIRLWNK